MEIIDVRGRMARCQLVLGADGVTLIDAGADPRAGAILDALAGRGLSVRDLRRIILTHGDGDHIAGGRLLQERSGADVVAHELEVAYIAGRVPRSFPIAKRAFGLFGRFLPRPRVTQTVSGPALEVADLEIVHAPGHTPGHVVVYAGDALLAGDAFRTGPAFAEVPAAMTVSRRLARDTIRRLAEREIEQAYSAHGPPTGDATERLRALASRWSPDRPPLDRRP